MNPAIWITEYFVRLPEPSEQNHSETTSSSGFSPFKVVAQNCSASKGISLTIANDVNNSFGRTLTITRILVTGATGMNASAAQGKSVSFLLMANNTQTINESQDYGGLPIGCEKSGYGYGANITIQYVELNLPNGYATGTISGVSSP